MLSACTAFNVFGKRFNNLSSFFLFLLLRSWYISTWGRERKSENVLKLKNRKDRKPKKKKDKKSSKKKKCQPFVYRCVTLGILISKSWQEKYFTSIWRTFCTFRRHFFFFLSWGYGAEGFPLSFRLFFVD